jgi:hypothetical protein
VETELTVSERLSWGYFRSRCCAEGLSKALVTEATGSTDALSSEWAYTRRTLATGVGRGLSDGVCGAPTRDLRAGAISGVRPVTTAGYLRGRLTHGTMRSAPQKAAS